ncbi:hypothetical protein [Pseudonocardia phyllosphaerae]|uniref:hypothetical protein n=1 Tax=Pseudonocardia phyllosphaerae TaxID=3390502 RepID=UPI0039792FF0
MTTQNQHGTTSQQPWWNEQQTPTAQSPAQIPAPRGGSTGGWAAPGPTEHPAPEHRAVARRIVKWAGLAVAGFVLLSVGIGIGADNAAPVTSEADAARIASLEQQLGDAQRSNQNLQASNEGLTTARDDLESRNKDLQTKLDSKPAASAPATPAATTESPTASSSAPEQTAPAQTTSGPTTTVSDGTYQVGTDIAAGRYKTAGPTSDSFGGMCYVSRNKDDSNEMDSIIANDIAQGPSSVTVKKGEFAEFSGGCTWTKQ